MPVIPKNTDVFVSIDITHPQTTVGLKNPAIFVKGLNVQVESYKEYTYLDAVEADFDSTSSVYKMAETIFAQNPAPELIAVITYIGDSAAPATSQAPTPTGLDSNATKDGAEVTADPVVINEPGDDIPTSGIAKAAFDYFYNNWEFALLADYDKTEALALADLIEHGGYDAKGFHICFLQFDDTNKADITDFVPYQRTFEFYHSNSEQYAAALAAAGAQPTIGKVSWKFVSDLANITPEPMPVSDAIALEKQGFILYIHKGNNNNQSNDKNLTGMYIDVIHGLDHVKATVETNLQNTLNTAGKTPYDTIGLGMIEASLESSLNSCYNDGIIATDPDTGKPMMTYNVPSIGTIGRVDIAQRVLNNTTFGYTPSSAINTMYVHGNMQEWI